jgi:AbrB family looped-hinge helix DNA binding protein
MREYHSSVSPKGQITLPAEVRHRLGIKPKDTVTIQVEGSEVRIMPAAFTLETAAESVPALAEPLTWEEIEARIKEDRDERITHALRRA